MEIFDTGVDNVAENASTRAPQATSPCGCNSADQAGCAAAGSLSRPNIEDGIRSTLLVEFLEVDMSEAGAPTCAACDEVRTALDAVVGEIRPLFGETGVDVAVKSARVQTETEARLLGLRASPTIRVRGLEITPDHKGSGEERVWRWAGKTYDAPPRGALVDVLLRAYAIDPPRVANRDAARESEDYELPAYLRRYLTPSDGASAGSPPACGC